LIEVKLVDLVNSAEALKVLGDKPLRGKLAYKVGKVIQAVSNELELYDKARRELLNKYCEKDENGEIIVSVDGNVQIMKDNIPDYNKEIAILNDTQIELNAVTLDLDDFEDIEMTPKEMVQIDWIIKKEETQE